MSPSWAGPVAAGPVPRSRVLRDQLSGPAARGPVVLDFQHRLGRDRRPVHRVRRAVRLDPVVHRPLVIDPEEHGGHPGGRPVLAHPEPDVFLVVSGRRVVSRPGRAIPAPARPASGTPDSVSSRLLQPPTASLGTGWRRSSNAGRPLASSASAWRARPCSRPRRRRSGASCRTWRTRGRWRIPWLRSAWPDRLGARRNRHHRRPRSSPGEQPGGN